LEALAAETLSQRTRGEKRHQLNELAYQLWRDNKIVSERSYYDPAQRPVGI